MNPRLALKNRAERLLKLLELEVPDSILGAEAWLILRAALALGPEANVAMVSRLVKDARNGMGLCSTVGCTHSLYTDGLCFGCNVKQQEADEQTLASIGLTEFDKCR